MGMISMVFKHPGTRETTGGQVTQQGEANKFQRRFFAKALPEPDFKYFSNSKACFSSLTAT
jgi:hypothetical protein